MKTALSQNRNGNSTDGVHLEKVFVTPALAAEWLSANSHNRKLRQERVGAMASDMLEGRWADNAETIKFAPDGTLLDGQHRLNALVVSGVSLSLWVATNVDPAAQETMDTGVARTLPDVLSLRGYANATNLAATLRRIYAYETHGKVYRVRQTGVAEASVGKLLEYVEQNHAYLNARTSAAAAFRKANPQFSLTAPDHAVLSHVFSKACDEEESEAFWVALCDRKPEVMKLLHGRLVDDKFDRQGKLPLVVKMALVVKAWNAWINGEELKLLKYRLGGAKPEKFPEVVGFVE